MPENLIETPEIQITPRIQALADSLNNDPVEIFTWTRNNIDYEPYYGSLKGSNETLIDMAGNDCDQSSLLIALLRASGTPARYVRGDVELKIEDLMNWTGGKTPTAAVKIMQSNWIPTEVLYKFKAIEGVIFDHIWVEIFDGHNWRLADPSYKEYVYTEGSQVTPEQETALANLMEGVITVSEDNKRFSTNQSLLEYAVEEAALIFEDNEISGRAILINEKNNLPPYLARGIIGDRKPAEEFAMMPDEMKFKARIAFPGLEGNTFLMADIASKTVSITYKMQNGGGSIFDVFPAFAFIMQPELRIDNLVVATGSSIGLGRYHNIEVSLLRPGLTWEVYNKSLIAGCTANICFTTQGTSMELMQEKAERLQAIMDDSGLLPEDTMTSQMISESLCLDGLMYFSLLDFIRDIVSKQIGIVNVNHISLAFIVDEIKPIGFFGLILGIQRAGAHIDVVRSANNPNSVTGNIEHQVEWTQLCGAFSTNLEHAMLELMYDIEAVSTGKIFAEANKTGIPIHRITPETLEVDLAQISANSTVKNHIRAYLTHETREFEALIPQRAITVGSWTGQGWVVSEPSTGCAGYMICGGLHNNMILNGGGLVEKLNNLLSQLARTIATIIEIVKALGIAGSILAVAAGLIQGALQLFASTLIGTSFLGGLFCIAAVAIALVAICVLNQLLINLMQHARFFISRRRQLVYVV